MLISGALKRMDGEDVFGRKIGTRYARSALQPTYSSDEGYSTAASAQRAYAPQQAPVACGTQASGSWALALQVLPTPTPPPLDFCPSQAPRPRKITGAHGSVNLDRSGWSSSAEHSRAASPWNSSASFSEPEPDLDTADLTVTNLPPYEPAVLQDMLTKLFNQYVPIIRVTVWTAGEGPLATVVLRSEWDARIVIARIHKRRLDNHWAGRRLELSLGRPNPAPNLDVLRARLRAILLDQKNYTLPLLRLRDAYASRHCCALTTSDIAKVKDTVIIHEGFGRMVQLIDHTPVNSSEMEEAPWKCHIHAGVSTGHEDGSRILQPVFMEISILAKNVNMLLENHGGILPLLSFVECYESMFPALVTDSRHGVALELLLRSIPAVEVKDSPSRHLTWSSRPHTPHLYHSETIRSNGEREKPRTAPSLEPMLALFERELIDLLRTAPRCSIPFSKLIPAFHHHFGRQCRVADYGFTKLPDLLAALSTSIVVLGSGSYRVITISATAQNRRWTSDLIKLLKAQPGRAVMLHDVPQLYQATFGRPFSPVDYGVCTVEELLEKVAPQSIIMADGMLSLPRRTPTPEEQARTIEFGIQAVELLCYTPNLRMEFSRFVPAYHSHFGRQLRVAHYGCVKLVDLFELIPDAVSVYCEANGERSVRLTAKAAQAVMSQRLKALAPIALSLLTARYTAQFGAPPSPDVLEVKTLEAMVYACGGFVQGGIVHMPGESPRWASAALAACAVLSADRSVARGSTEEYFVSAFRALVGAEPDLPELAGAGVLETAGRHVRLSNTWRCVWRVAQMLSERSPMSSKDIFVEFSKHYGPSFPKAELGIEAVGVFLRQYAAIFTENGDQWSLCGGVMPQRRDLVAKCVEDYSVHDTPPGQKGSRVFESPKTGLWCSPPASALPAPTALLAQDNKRRTRLAAQFDAA
ncbi:meiosis regulator and mRNA stability factor 1 isoform X2 [Aricia agestis]|uniref:meiosis regulator and mRNA stability factor 1 isoform X2 n=1 Tax=Aricia agestis TaxID=91739 RepID=UPI001C203F23|nr:meiosis regulator and mRNA stability factor 1 isoform X2 [Aricia agestis]